MNRNWLTATVTGLELQYEFLPKHLMCFIGLVPNLPRNWIHLALSLFAKYALGFENQLQLHVNIQLNFANTGISTYGQAWKTLVEVVGLPLVWISGFAGLSHWASTTSSSLNKCKYATLLSGVRHPESHHSIRLVDYPVCFRYSFVVFLQYQDKLWVLGA